MWWVALIGALFTVLYVTFLGTEGRPCQLMRRYGIDVCFGGTLLAQLILTLKLRALRAARADIAAKLPAWLLHAKVALVGLIALLGVAFFSARYGLGIDPDRLENLLEWIVAAAMQAIIVLTVVAWGRTGLRVRVGLFGG